MFSQLKINCSSVPLIILFVSFSYLCSCSLLYFTACTAETEKVCNVSSEERLQPFKDKMEEFLTRGKKTLQT